MKSGNRGNRRNRGNTGNTVIIVVIMLTMMLLGFLLAVIINYFHNKKTDEVLNSKSDSIKVLNLDEGDDAQINVYIPDRKRVYGKIPINSYNPDNFSVENGFKCYYDENGNKISHVGVDLSYHQENVDFDKLASSGIEFVMLRCGYRGFTEGGLIEDEKFREYAAECNSRNIPMGVYFFTQAITNEEAIAEADFVISLIEDYNISYPVVLDTENVSDKEARTNLANLTKEDRTSFCISFLERIRENGYYPMIYASENWVRRSLVYEKIQEYDLWSAQYQDVNDYLYDYTIWQYTDSGNVPGVDEAVDINISMVDYTEFVPALREAYLKNANFEVVESKNTVIMDDNGLEGENANAE